MDRQLIVIESLFPLLRSALSLACKNRIVRSSAELVHSLRQKERSDTGTVVKRILLVDTDSRCSAVLLNSAELCSRSMGLSISL